MKSYQRRALRALPLAIASITAAMHGHAGDLQGRVVDAEGTVGLPGVAVEIEGTPRRAATDVNGYFRLNGLPAGTYQVLLKYPGAQAYRGEVVIDEVGLAKLEARMRPIGDYDEEVWVIGQRAAQASALSQQRASDSISSFLTRDAIGQFPDQNVTEAVRRLAGVSVQNDQGEGRFIVLRGLDPNLNSASVNGVRLPAPESDIRAVALDVVPSELVDSIEFQKSLTPEMDGDAIGGAINIRTPSALERDDDLLALTVTGSYNDLEELWSPKFGLQTSTRISDRLGVSAGVSYFKRRLGSDNTEAEDWTDADGITYAEGVELRDYRIDRTRIGGTLGVDFVLNDSTMLFARGLYSSFEDYEIRSRLSADFGDASPVSGDNNSATFNLAGDEVVEVVRDVKDRTETQEIMSLQLGGETISDGWTFNYEAAFSAAEEEESDNPDTTDFVTEYAAGELGLVQSGLRGGAVFLEPASGSEAAYTNASRYEFDGVEYVNGLAEDEELSFKLDIVREFFTDNGMFELKGGIKSRMREKSYDSNVALYDGYEGPGDFTLDQVATDVTFGLGPISPMPSPGAVRGILGDFSNFELNQVESEFENAAASFNVTEDILAGYLQGRYESDVWRVIGGVRVERTENDIEGSYVQLIEAGGVLNGAAVEDDITVVDPVSFDKSNTQVLPSLNVRYEATDDVVLRGAAYASMFRPNIGDLAPRFIVEVNDGNEREGEFGNPDLDPYAAWNFEFGTEWYFAENAVLQGSVFYKEIDDFIFRVTRRDFDFNGVFIDEGSIPFNGQSAEVAGLELNYQQAFDNGFLVGANYTVVDSEADTGTRSVALPGTSENVFNFVLGYETDKLNVRLAWVYRDEYLDELSQDGDLDEWVLEHDQLDLTAKYQVTDNGQVFLEAINILDEPFEAVLRTPEYGDRLLQYEEYSFTVNLGFRFNF